MKEGRLMQQLSMTQKQTMTSALRVGIFFNGMDGI